MRHFKVSKAGSGQRADVFITAKFPDYARSTLHRLFEGEMVKVNGRTAKASHKLRLDDRLSVDDSLLRAKPPKIDIPIIFENDDVVVMDKPAGVLTHSKGAFNDEPTVASFLSDKITDDNLTGNRAGIVHRLDRATSGVIIGAKNSKALSHLQKQFAQRRTKKSYLAIVQGQIDPAEAVIDAPIARNPKKPQTFFVNSSGKTAQTHYQTVKIFSKNSKDYSQLVLKPTTGRTHQLRVHLKYINHPIVGDPIYGQAGDNLLLHAASLELTLPGGERRVFESVTPKYFKDFHSNAK
jgi:23S rRNA pseudouridine1911/1915/1917 synthase